MTCGAAARLPSLCVRDGSCQPDDNRRPRPDWSMRLLGGRQTALHRSAPRAQEGRPSGPASGPGELTRRSPVRGPRAGPALLRASDDAAPPRLKLPERPGPSAGPTPPPQRARSLVGTPKPYQSSDWVPPVSWSSRHLTAAHQLRATPQPCTNECSISRRRNAASHGPLRQQRPSVCMRLLGGIPDTPSPSALRPHGLASGLAGGPWNAIPSGVQPVGRRTGTSFGGQAFSPGQPSRTSIATFANLGCGASAAT